MTFRRLTAALLACIMCVGIFASCAADTSPEVLTLDSYKITANMYNYWASTSKANFLSADSSAADTEQFWSSEYASGVSFGEYCDSLIQNDIKKTLICLKLFDDEKLSLPDETVKAIDDGIELYLNEYADGNKNTFNATLAKYGANMDILRNIYIAEAKREMLYNHLYGEGGRLALTDADKEEFFMERYYHLQIIYINDKFEQVTDEEGNYVTNADGTYATRALSEEEEAKKKAAIDAVKAGIEAGEDFNALYEKYSEMKSYKDGYYFSPDASYGSTLFNILASEIAAVEIGKTTVYESDGGTYIMKRYENGSGDWKKEAYSDFFSDFDSTASLAAFAEYIEPYFAQITADTEKISEYSIKTVTPNYSF